MAIRLSLWLLLVVCTYCSARPEGPPISAVPDVCSDMQPRHPENFTIEGSPLLSAQTSEVPYELILTPSNTSSYGAGDTITITLRGTNAETFRGFMIQARTRDGRTFGTFRNNQNSRVQILACSYDEDTAAHSNVNKVDLDEVTLQWIAPSDREDIRTVTFYYTVVQTYEIFWEMQEGDSLSLQAKYYQCKRKSSSSGRSDLALVRAHGVLMTLAWGLLAPVGIVLVLFYKVVWPNGQWFYAHIALMCSAIAVTLLGILPIVIHAKGQWLTSTDVNTPHQILGIVATATVCLNPFMALVRCEPDSKWRWIYNWTHGSIGLVLGQSVAFCTMLLGLYVFRELVYDCQDAHIAIYTTAGAVGVVGTTIVLYNLYTVSYHKVHRKPGADYEREDEVLESSSDAWFRLVVGGVAGGVLVLITMATAIFITIADEEV